MHQDSFKGKSNVPLTYQVEEPGEENRYPLDRVALCVLYKNNIVIRGCNSSNTVIQRYISHNP